MLTTFFWILMNNMTSFSQNKYSLFTHYHCFSCSMKGFNRVLSICIDNSFGKVAKGWGGTTGAKFLCVDDGSQCFLVEIQRTCYQIEQLV